MCYVMKRGVTQRQLLVFAAQAGTGAPQAGLRHDSSGAAAGYHRAGEARARPIALVPGQPGRWDSGGFAEIDPVLVPGVYQFGLPDEALAVGADAVVVVLRFAGVAIEPIHIHLVAYDPQDSSRLGMSALGPEGRIAALRGAFPRLTARELAEDAALRGDR
jgi:hypothetical protein